MGERATEAVGGVDGKIAVGAGDTLDGLVLAYIEGVVLGDFAVVLERFITAGLLVGAGEGHVADLKQLGRGEENHVGGVVKERVAEAALVDEHGGEACALGFNGTGEAGGASSDDEQIG